MLKVAPCTVVRRTTKFFRLDGLLLFYIVMGLSSASSAIINSSSLPSLVSPFCSLDVSCIALNLPILN